jgi:hypothetical protein
MHNSNVQGNQQQWWETGRITLMSTHLGDPGCPRECLMSPVLLSQLHFPVLLDADDSRLGGGWEDKMPNGTWQLRTCSKRYLPLLPLDSKHC